MTALVLVHLIDLANVCAAVLPASILMIFAYDFAAIRRPLSSPPEYSDRAVVNAASQLWVVATVLRQRARRAWSFHVQ